MHGKFLNLFDKKFRTISKVKSVDQWDPQNDDTKTTLAEKRYMRVAWNFVQLRKDWESYKTMDKKNNVERASEYLPPAMIAIAGKSLAHVALNEVNHPVPNLGPLKSERELEVTNRFFDILKHLEGVLTRTTRKWNKRFLKLSRLDTYGNRQVY